MWWIGERPVYGQVARALDIEYLDGTHPTNGSAPRHCPACGQAIQDFAELRRFYEDGKAVAE
jgi:hypothetical protein